MTALRYRAVVFDLDGTLVDSYAALAGAVNYARREHGLPDLSAARIRDFVGEGLERLLQRAFDSPDVPRSAQDAFERRYDEICCEESHVLAGVASTLAQLAALGVSMAVCTNKPTMFSRKILEFLQLAGYFRAIVGPDLAGARKPDAQTPRAPPSLRQKMSKRGASSDRKTGPEPETLPAANPPATTPPRSRK